MLTYSYAPIIKNVMLWGKETESEYFVITIIITEGSHIISVC